MSKGHSVLRFRPWLGMRWWLGLSFAAIASITAIAVVQVLGRQTEAAFRERATELAVGGSVGAGIALDRAPRGTLEESLREIGERRKLSLFVFDGRGRQLTSTSVPLEDVPFWQDALAAALEGHRFVETTEDGVGIVVGLPLSHEEDRAALVSYALRPDLVAATGIVRDEAGNAALWASLGAALVGLLVATLVTRRIRRVTVAAGSIAGGDFGEELRPRFPDELGMLAAAVDEMRSRLRVSFADLEADRDRVHRLLSQLDDGVVAVGPDLRVELVNAAARRLLGAETLAEGDPLPEPWPDTPLRATAAVLFEAGAALTRSDVHLGEDTHYVLVGIPPTASSTSAVLVVSDASAEERRERAEREFVTNAAHELRTPVAAILSLVEALQAGAKDVPGDRDEFLAHLEREANRLARLTRALLVLARAQTEDGLRPRATVRVRHVLDAVAAGLDPPPELSVEVDCPPGLSALGDADLLEQAVTSAALNACKYAGRGRVVLAGRREDGAVVVEVVDDGPGIAPGARTRLFDRFYQGDAEPRDGFGLGLAIVREAVRAQGGEVEVRSEPGEGTTVRMTLTPASHRERVHAG